MQDLGSGGYSLLIYMGMLCHLSSPAGSRRKGGSLAFGSQHFQAISEYFSSSWACISLLQLPELRQGCILHRREEPGHTSVLGPKMQVTALMPFVTLDGYLSVIFSLVAFF